jgi:hypothetical protein
MTWQASAVMGVTATAELGKVLVKRWQPVVCRGGQPSTEDTET